MGNEFDKDRAIEIAEKAAEIIDNGWYQGNYTDGKGNYCAFGALRMAAFGNISDMPRSKEYDVVWITVSDLLKRRGKHFYIPGFNDDPDTTQADVSDLLRLTAKEIANND